jgi:CBS domain containing-hemolysin-like protein
MKVVVVLFVVGGAAIGGWSMPWVLLAIAVLVGGSGFFAGVETAVISANRARLERQAEEGRRDARAALRLLADTPGTIAGTLVGTNVCNTGAAALATAAAVLVWPRYGPAIATLLLTPVVLLVGEILPKAWFRSRPTRLLRACAGTLRGFLVLFRPILAVTSAATHLLLFLGRVPRAERRPVFEREDLETLFLYGRPGSEAPESSDRAEAALRMAGRVLDLQRRGVREAMVPLPESRILEAGGTVGEARARFRETGAKVLAVRDGSGHIRGFVAAKDLLGVPLGQTVGGQVRPALRLGPQDSLDRAITGFRRRRLGMAVVRDRQGNPLGVLSPEDVLEEVVGEIRESGTGRGAPAEPKD